MEDIWVIDGHCDSLMDFSTSKRSLKGKQGGQWDLEKARQGKIGLQFLAAFIESAYKPERSISRGLELIQAAHRFVVSNSEEVFFVREHGDLQRLPQQDKLGILLSVEGGEILGDSLFMLDIIHHLGVRALGLTWNRRNSIGDGADEQTHSRLTHFGESVVRRMNELGMIIDVSHLNEAGFWHVLELSSTRIIASHSCAAALCPHARNLNDQQLKALAQAGGVVGINYYPDFLNSAGKAKRWDVIQHIVHIANVAGVEIIGLGSDFDGISKAPEGLESVDKTVELIEDLKAAGFNKEEIQKICFGNFMRLLLNVIK